MLVVPGAPSEVETIRRIFQMFVRKRLSRPKIAAKLNADGAGGGGGGAPWSAIMVRSVLTNELIT